MATAKELFLVQFKYWLVTGGTTTRRAWGKMIRAHELGLAQSLGLRGLVLAAVDGEDAGADDFADKRRGVKRQAEQQRGEFRRQHHAAGKIESRRG